jgi:hypothetical protein
VKAPWVKLWRNILNDEKVSFILRRYGHDCLTFWIGMLTKCEDGVLHEDEDIFADLCLLETKRYEEIRSVFIKRGLVSVDADGLLVVNNWDEYQVGESTERVRRFREKANANNETLQKRECNADETKMERVEGEGELEGDREGEGGGAREDAPPAPDGDDFGEEEVPDQAPASPDAVVRDWFNALSSFTRARVEPPPKAAAWAQSVISIAGGDMAKVLALRQEYFDSWRELWFAYSRGDKGKPERDRAPDFDFRQYCANIPAIASRIAAREHPPARPVYPREPPPTPEERSEAAAVLAQAMAAAGYERAKIA